MRNILPDLRQTAAPEAETGSAPVTEDTPTRTKIANRVWVDDAGDEVEPEVATGVLYEFLGRTKDGIAVPADGKSYTVSFSSLTDAARNMLTGFGALTLMGNETNTWLGEKGDEKADKAADAIAARFALLNEGTWIDRSRAGVGAKVDKDALAEAVVRVAESAGKTADKAAIRQKLEDSPEWARSVKALPAVATEYSRIMGRETKSLDELLTGL